MNYFNVFASATAKGELEFSFNGHDSVTKIAAISMMLKTMNRCSSEPRKLKTQPFSYRAWWM